MPLSSATERTPSHTRKISYDCFRRTDGAWDVDIRLTDVKGYPIRDIERGVLEPGRFVHDISVRVTIDTGMNVLSIETSMDAVPYSLCDGGSLGAQTLVGANLAQGWREALNGALGRTRGCTHLKEMLFGAATAAFQTIGSEVEHRIGGATVADHDRSTTPFYIDGCYSFSTRRAVVAAYFPQFAIDDPQE